MTSPGRRIESDSRGLDYRFEAFVPAPQRKHDYYVLPLLEGERLVGRVDPKLFRDQGLLEIRRVWWEPGVRQSKGRIAGLEPRSSDWRGWWGRSGGR